MKKLKYLGQYIISIGKKWIISVFLFTDIVGLIYFYKNPSSIPYIYFIIILLILFVIANYLVFSENIEKIDSLDRSRFLQKIRNLLLSELRDLEPKLYFTHNQELGQVVFNIDVYWKNINGILHSEKIGFIYLIDSYEKPVLEFRENKFLTVNESGYTIWDLKNHLKNTTGIANLIIDT